MRITVAQMNPTVGDIEGNFSKIVRGLQQVKKDGSDLVVFPELFLTGYPPKDLLERRWFLGKTQEVLKDIVRLSTHNRGAISFWAALFDDGLRYHWDDHLSLPVQLADPPVVSRPDYPNVCRSCAGRRTGQCAEGVERPHRADRSVVCCGVHRDTCDQCRSLALGLTQTSGAVAQLPKG